MFDLLEVQYMELSWVFSIKERGIITGIFDLAEVKNMELSRVYSICQK